jgi:hypothetical protein
VADLAGRFQYILVCIFEPNKKSLSLQTGERDLQSLYDKLVLYKSAKRVLPLQPWVAPLPVLFFFQYEIDTANRPHN